MIVVEDVKRLVESAVSGSGSFLVEAKVNPGNKILILLDHKDGLSIDECVKVSKYVEHHLDREKEDFELQVSSPGLESPFKVLQQYEKSIGKQVEVTTLENQKICGKLLGVNEQEIELEESRKNKKETTITLNKINFNQIKQTKRIISFKF
jgi:ribosome maturation factor RimP